MMMMGEKCFLPPDTFFSHFSTLQSAAKMSKQETHFLSDMLRIEDLQGLAFNQMNNL